MDVSWIIISSFWEKQGIFNDTALIAQNHFLTQKYKTSF